MACSTLANPLKGRRKSSGTPTGEQVYLLVIDSFARKVNEDDHEQKMDKISQKLLKSQINVEESQKKFQHEMELRNEVRRLREHDIMMERQSTILTNLSRNEKARRNQEKSDYPEGVEGCQGSQEQVRIHRITYRQLKNKYMNEQLMNNRIQELIKKDIFMETIQNVVHNDTSPRKRNKMLHDMSLNISINKAVIVDEKKPQNQKIYM